MNKYNKSKYASYNIYDPTFTATVVYHVNEMNPSVPLYEQEQVYIVQYLWPQPSFTAAVI